MKVRFVERFIRFRLAREEVEQLLQSGSVTLKMSQKLQFSLLADSPDCSIEHQDGRLIVKIPTGWIEGWDQNDTVGFDFELMMTEDQPVRIVIEKDFPCGHDPDGNPVAARPVKMQPPASRS